MRAFLSALFIVALILAGVGFWLYLEEDVTLGELRTQADRTTLSHSVDLASAREPDPSADPAPEMPPEPASNGATSGVTPSTSAESPSAGPGSQQLGALNSDLPESDLASLPRADDASDDRQNSTPPEQNATISGIDGSSDELSDPLPMPELKRDAPADAGPDSDAGEPPETPDATIALSPDTGTPAVRDRGDAARVQDDDGSASTGASSDTGGDRAGEDETPGDAGDIQSDAQSGNTPASNRRDPPSQESASDDDIDLAALPETAPDAEPTGLDEPPLQADEPREQQLEAGGNAASSDEPASTSADGEDTPAAGPAPVDPTPALPTPENPAIALVVIDLGQSSAATESAIQRLPGAVTLAFTPYANTLSRWLPQAVAAGHEVLMMVPMEPVSYPRDDPGPQTLLTSLTAETNLSRLDWALGRGEGYIGVVNNMGSRMTASRDSITPILDEIQDRGLMFLDSRTARNSVVGAVAGEIGLPVAVNDRFIDRVAARNEIDAQLAELESVARQRGYAVGIAGSYPVTFERIAAWLPTLEDKDIDLVPISRIAYGTDSLQAGATP
ncbi:divergent polysaccharide deacetylase family protein [Fodinicurvata sp. EGI_FJ10296]|uniref:divergent polysaccharide deacetylase family protein n=1 Tax=Fodinicurvata sp. EGI_FJ10296 TaxID=3231908 RepID=UPI00345728DA